MDIHMYDKCIWLHLLKKKKKQIKSYHFRILEVAIKKFALY